MCDVMCTCGNELNLCKLCVNKQCANHVGANSITASKLCVSDTASAVNLNVQNETVNNLCVSQNLYAASAGINSLNSNSLCSQNGTINTLCVNNLSVGSLNYSLKYRAAVTFNSNVTYTLGQPINWNVVLDDPNNNVTVSPQFSYTVPMSGYYIVTLHMDMDSLSGSGIITGVPVSNMLLMINGNELRSQISPFLTFNNSQKTSLTSLCLLNAGDNITMNYNILIFDPVSGLIPYTGTINIEGNGTFPGESGFAIHYLSSLNATPVVCQTCPSVSVPCQPNAIMCTDNPCDTMCCTFSSIPGSQHRK